MTPEEQVLYETSKLVADGRTVQRWHAILAADILRYLAEADEYTGQPTRGFLKRCSTAGVKGWTW